VTVASIPYRARGQVPPTFTNGWPRGNTVSRKTTNKKQPICTDHYESAIIALVKPKNGGARQNKIPALGAGRVSPRIGGWSKISRCRHVCLLDI